MSNENAAQLASDIVRPPDLEVFISHHHRYSGLANVLCRTIADRSSGSIAVYQTSDAGANPVAVGEVI